MTELSKQILELIQQGGWSFLSADKLADNLTQAAGGRQQAFDCIAELEAQGYLSLTAKGKYALSQKLGLVRGRVSGNKKGFAFLVPDDRETSDLFIAPSGLSGALNGDIVLARSALSVRGRDEAEVERIIERGVKRLVGKYFTARGGGWVQPDDSRNFKDIFIPDGSQLGAQDGDKVHAEITVYPVREGNPEGAVIEILGKEGRGSDILGLIRSFSLYEEFPPAVLAQAKKVEKSPAAAEIARREDLRGEVIVTIDGEDAKDLDDAVNVKRLQSGGYELGVHIADVSHYVKPGSALDGEARKRGTSVYFPSTVFPMLPKELSNGICSLNSGQDRLTLSVFITFTSEGKPEATRISKTVIRTAARMTYSAVTAILEGDTAARAQYADLVPQFELMHELCTLLAGARRSRGAVDLDIPQVKVLLGEDGEIDQIIPYPRGVSDRIIEEFMICANEAVARYMTERANPFIYRVHEKPLPEKVAAFADFSAMLGFKLSGNFENIKPAEYNRLLGMIEDVSVRNLVNRVMLRTMAKAKYFEQNLGHFGLSSKCYTHFTSPIRRYPDLFIHRIIKAEIEGSLDSHSRALYSVDAREAAYTSSEREKAADEAERAVDDYYKAEYMLRRVGESFWGVVSGVKDFGIFIELENTVEGLVRMENLPQDAYEYNERMYTLRGREHSFRLGDRLEVTVLSALPLAGKVEFTLTQLGGEMLSGGRLKDVQTAGGRKGGAPARSGKGGTDTRGGKGGQKQGSQSNRGAYADKDKNKGAEKGNKRGDASRTKKPKGSVRSNKSEGESRYGLRSEAAAGEASRTKKPKGSVRSNKSEGESRYGLRSEAAARETARTKESKGSVRSNKSEGDTSSAARTGGRGQSPSAEFRLDNGGANGSKPRKKSVTRKKPGGKPGPGKGGRR